LQPPDSLGELGRELGREGVGALIQDVSAAGDYLGLAVRHREPAQGFGHVDAYRHGL